MLITGNVMRLRPASVAAASKLANCRVTPGSPRDEVSKATSSPSKLESTVAAAALYVLWPETYSGKGGVINSDDHSGSAAVAGFTSTAACFLAVMGRHKS